MKFNVGDRVIFRDGDFIAYGILYSLPYKAKRNGVLCCKVKYDGRDDILESHERCLEKFTKLHKALL